VLVLSNDVLEEISRSPGRLQTFASSTTAQIRLGRELIDVLLGDYPNPEPIRSGVQMGGYEQLSAW